MDNCPPHSYVAYPPVLEDAIAQVMPLVMEQSPDRTVEPRWTALKLLEYEDRIAPELRGQELEKLLLIFSIS